MYQETYGCSRFRPGPGGASGWERLMFGAYLLTDARPYIFVHIVLAYADAFLRLHWSLFSF